MSTTVWHWLTYNISLYNIVQHRYGLMDYKNNSQGQGLAGNVAHSMAGGYAELLEILDGPKDKRIIVHLFLNSEGSSYFVYNNLEFAKVGYQYCLDKGFVRSRDISLPGSLSWGYTGYNLPWFYAETKEGVK